jgi:acetate kinase
MGGVDILIFTGGIGENGSETREAMCRDMEFLGVEFDKEVNDGVRGKELIISKKDSRVTVMIVPTNEEFVIASETKTIVENLNKK